MLFNGANIAEVFDLSANGERLRFTRNIANITMDTNDVETVDINTLGGVDKVTVHDLAGTDVTKVNVDLRRQPGQRGRRGRRGGHDRHRCRERHRPGGRRDRERARRDGLGLARRGGRPATADTLAGDDRIAVAGTEGDDTLTLRRRRRRACSSRACRRSSPSPTTAADQAFVNGLGGNDVIAGAGQAAQAAGLRIDGGPGNDTINGTQGVETLVAGDGNDFVDGNRGNDVAQLGAGDDTFQWDPGDGSDTIKGQTGFDTMLFNGANIAERIDMSANGSFLRFTRDIANIAWTLNNLETVASTRSAAPTPSPSTICPAPTRRGQPSTSAALGGTTGDGAADQRRRQRHDGGDDVAIVRKGGDGAANVCGLAAQVDDH